MGDIPPRTNPGSDYASPEMPQATRQGMMPEDGSSTLPQSSNPLDTAAFQGQYQHIYAPLSNTFSNQLDIPITQGSGRQGPYDMGAIANALPQSGYRPGYGGGQQHQRYTPPGPSMMPHMVQFPGQPHMSQLANQQYYLPQQQQIPQFFNAQMSPTTQQHQQHQHHQPGLTPPRAGMNMGFYPNSIMMNQSQAPVQGYYYSPPNQFPTQNPSVHNHMAQSQYFIPDGSSGDLRGSSPLQKSSGGVLGGFVSNEEFLGDRSNTVRGPPRKPRQSGHAIWIGNLPPQTDLMSLVHHVCKEAAGLESLFLISKSNCAFANFKDEASCMAAQQRLHDSNFQLVRLVSRLRKSTVEGTSGQTAPTGPAATSPSSQPVSSDPPPSSPPSTSVNPSSTKEEGVETHNTPVADGSQQQKDKFFILKSLTVEDLDLSIRNGVWATQSHNEEALNKAFGAVDNVYLIFSANKSGEYFGYARMVSPIDHDPAAAIEFAPKAQATNNVDLPKAIPTEATETCPRGRIIDDSARGTIFWEVERDEVDGVSDTISEDSGSARSMPEGEGESKAWGKPFKLEWLSTTRLPFYRTRGLRNPWNSNREVKIARDGTELEPTVGRKLIGLFNRVQSPSPMPTMGMRAAGLATGYPPPMPPHFRQ